MEISGWGRNPRASVLAARPESPAEALEALTETRPESILVHGAGRSYGDVALNHRGRVLLTERLNRLLSFDEESLELVCEPGVTFQDLLHVFGPRGYLFPVSPGTAYTTVGGAVANDIHGKNHEIHGSFGDHVLWMDLALPSGEVRRVSPSEDRDLFEATIGGIGLTGVMLRIAFRMLRVPSTDVVVQERRMGNLDAFTEAFEACRRSATYSVGWIDGLSRGANMGRGILETAEIADMPAPPSKARRNRTVPIDFPSKALNPLTIRAFNSAYFHRVPAGGRTRTAPITRLLYPLDAILRWNRVYGKRGFHQFQCVIPNFEAPSGLRTILETVGALGAMPFLGVLKTFGSQGRGHLSFPMQGYTLALDFPHRDDTWSVLRRLEAIVLEHRGRVYLAKDSALSPEGFRTMYPKHADYCQVLLRIDPEERFSSDLARRIGLRR